MALISIVAALAAVAGSGEPALQPSMDSSRAPQLLTLYAMTSVLAAYPDLPRDPMHPDALDMNAIDNSKELLGMVAGMNEEERTIVLRSTLYVLEKRMLKSSGSTKRRLETKKKVVRGAMDRLDIH